MAQEPKHITEIYASGTFLTIKIAGDGRKLRIPKDTPMMAAAILAVSQGRKIKVNLEDNPADADNNVWNLEGVQILDLV